MRLTSETSVATSDSHEFKSLSHTSDAIPNMFVPRMSGGISLREPLIHGVFNSPSYTSDAVPNRFVPRMGGEISL
jgi:hypothetical protein